MSTFNQLVASATQFAQSEFGRVVATAATIGAAAASLKYVQKRVRQLSGRADVARGRSKFVAARNLILLVTLTLLGFIWATKIAGAALSLAAVAGGMLVVTKDFLANLLGTAMFAVCKPFRIGDFVEMANVSGLVVDNDLMSTTLAETQQAHQLTGRTVVIPNSVLLSTPVRNLSATGAYVVHILPIAVPADADLLACKTALLAAANSVCGSWIAAANKHFEQLEARELLDLPSAAPNVLLANMNDAGGRTLALRYACRPHERVHVEQEIMMRYLQAVADKPPGKKKA